MVRRTSQPVSITAPTGGWNARDSIAAMEQADAVTLENLYPKTTNIELRFGHSKHATGLPGQVETLIDYNGAAVETLFGISGTAVYNVTSSGAVGAAVLSGLTNARWQYINVATPGGNYIEMCNGADAVYTWDNTTWVDQSGNITGVTSSNLININLHKNRIWFIESNTLKAWYLPTQSISGVARALDLSAFCPCGGFLMAMGTWTIDAGYGVDDLAVFITNQGDVAVFRGTDPASATTWALVGMWTIGAPIGRRCFRKFGGDLLLINEDGLQPMSLALQSSRTNPRTALSDKIRSEMAAAVTNYGTNYGWELAEFPPQNMLLMNVPVAAGRAQQQYVMNTLTGSWCKFTGWEANCFNLFSNNELYFGGNKFVGQAWDTNADDGNPIEYMGLQAFSYFGSPGQVKRFTMMRPTFMIDGTVDSIKGNINVDYDQSMPVSDLTMRTITGDVWDTAVWDTAQWGGDLSLSEVWQGAKGVGRAGATTISGSSNGTRLKWLATDIIFEPGGML